MIQDEAQKRAKLRDTVDRWTLQIARYYQSQAYPDASVCSFLNREINRIVGARDAENESLSNDIRTKIADIESLVSVVKIREQQLAAEQAARKELQQLAAECRWYVMQRTTLRIPNHDAGRAMLARIDAVEPTAATWIPGEERGA